MLDLAPTQARPTIAVNPHGITVFIPTAAPDLAARRVELEMMTEYDPETYPALWDALAGDFEAVYGPESVNAERCRAKARHYRALAAF